MMKNQTESTELELHDKNYRPIRGTMRNEDENSSNSCLFVEDHQRNNSQSFKSKNKQTNNEFEMTKGSIALSNSRNRKKMLDTSESPYR